jgi:DNA-binding winged helix-turn-helix (wHTH) protein/cytochrome c-type biogenesis protein CcmH/NrfG
MRGEVYQFGEFTLDAAERRLERAGQRVSLAPKALDLLVELVRRGGELVRKRELLDLVWPEAFVEEGILAVHISALRKALAEKGQELIETVPRAGYRFTAAVTRRQLDAADGERKRTVAVLPARPLGPRLLSSDEASAGLAIADALIDQLGRCPELVVRPVRAAQAYAESADPAAAGRALQVEAVVSPVFVATAEGIRISVRLTGTGDGALMWSGDFRESQGVAECAAAAAACIAARLGSCVGEARPAPAVRQRAANPETYLLLGRGRFHLLGASMFDIPKAVEAYRKATDLDPVYAPAHAGLAMACCAQAAYRLCAPAKAYGEARTAALRALAMDDACADAQTALGMVMFFGEWNWTGAERSLLRALQLNPNHTEAYLAYGQLLDALGRLEHGLDAKLRALERDPYSPLVHLQLAMSYWNQRRYDDAIDWANRALELDARHPHAREFLAGAYLKKGDFERYLTECLKHAEAHGVTGEALEDLRRNSAMEGRAGLVRRVLENAAAQPGAFPAMQLALFHGEAGQMDEAFAQLNRAIDERDPALVHLAVGPQWDGLRCDDRFESCLERMGLRAAS